MKIYIYPITNGSTYKYIYNSDKSFEITLRFSYLYWTVTATCLTILIICSTITADDTIAFNITCVPIYTNYGPLTRVIPSICVT